MALGVASVVLITVSSVLKMAIGYVVIRFAQMRQHHISVRLLQAYLRQPYEFYLNRNSADLSKSLLSEVDHMITNVVKPVMNIFAYGVTVLVLVTLLVLVSPVIALLSASILGGMFALSYMSVRGVLGRIGIDRHQANKERYKATIEAFGGIKDLKVLGREDAYIKRFVKPSTRYARDVILSSTIATIPRLFIEMIAFGGVLGLAIFLMLTRDGPGEVLPLLGVYAFAGSDSSPRCKGSTAQGSKLRFGMPSLDEIHRDLTERVADTPELPQARTALPLKEAIRFEGLRYRYPGAERWALDELDLTIPARTSAAFVGQTGAGKTTAVDLILGLLSPTEGAIVVDGQPLVGRETVRRWQRSVGYVPQTIYLTDASVSQNIAFGIDPATVDQAAVEKAARIANIHDFIMSELPSGYATEVGERGVRLSGGQRQRIGIARALYHDPELLVLDEATSALDTPTEQAIMDSVERLSGEKTVIIIAHRLSTVRHCEQIAVLEHGRLVGTGTFDELVDSNPAFQRLVSGDPSALDGSRHDLMTTPGA
jgi:ATP-binding cassette, subfamily B, bacterial PglK